jgi:hypothetical protein
VSDDQEAWCAFLERALWGLRRAVSEVHAPQGKTTHRKKPGYWRVARRIAGVDRVRVPSETAMSEAIVREFKGIAAQQFIEGTKHDEFDLRHFHAATEQVRKFDTGIGDHSNPTDISIELREGIIFDLRIEAKTVTALAAIKKGYVNEGLKRFDDAGNPYTVERFGAMIAYVVTEDEATWEGRLGDGVTAFVGSDRVCTTALSGRPFTTSIHRFINDAIGPDEVEVRVIHLVFPVEADPVLNSA